MDALLSETTTARSDAFARRPRRNLVPWLPIFHVRIPPRIPQNRTQRDGHYCQSTDCSDPLGRVSIRRWVPTWCKHLSQSVVIHRQTIN